MKKCQYLIGCTTVTVNDLKVVLHQRVDED